MGLKIETGYTKANGEQVSFEYPKMIVRGKDFDNDEAISFQVLVEAKKFQTDRMKYAKYTMFAKEMESGQAYTLDFSESTYNRLNQLEVQKGDIISIKRHLWTNPENGMMMPLVEVNKTDGNNKVAQSTQDEAQVKKFALEYAKNVDKDKQNYSHFIGSYIRVFMPELVDQGPMKKLFDTYVQN